MVYRKTTRQTSLLEYSHWLGGSARDRLKESWSEGFRSKVLPLLLDGEDRFQELYSAVGRPNWSVARMLGCLLLMELTKQSDQELLDSVVFDIRYQHALGMTGQEAYLSRRSLVEFRSRLVQHDPEMHLLRQLFDQICAQALREMKLSTKQQRLDSTWLTSNIRIRGRLGLFRQTVRHFMLWLQKHEPSQMSALSSELCAWHRDFDDSWECPREVPKHRPLILQLARWAYEIVQQFAGQQAIASQEPYQLVERLIREQCVLTQGDHSEGEGGPEGTEPESPREPEARVHIAVHPVQHKGDGAMRTPHDPAASTGHKGVGYHVQVAETCNNEGPELITDFQILPAHQPDTGRATESLERLAARDMQPEVLYADGGYPTPKSMVEAQALGTRLHAPVSRQNMLQSKMSRMDFVLDEQSGQVLACPQGHAPVLHRNRAATTARHSLFALFDAATCRACPELAHCPVQSPGKERPAGKFRLEMSRGLVLRDKQYVEQRSEQWREAYRIRAGVEATMSELKRAHGLERLRVRRMPRVHLAVAFKLMACNVKRWVRCVLAPQVRASQPLAQAA